MANTLIFPVGSTSACRYAVGFLEKAGFRTVDHPTPDATHLLLDVPSFGPDELLRSGEALDRILERLPEYITVIGGNLSHSALNGYRKFDLLTDDSYLAENARITADCALQVAAPLLTRGLYDSPALIIGWGRIGKCLGQLLKGLGNDVTIAARKSCDRAMIRALGCKAVHPDKIHDLKPYRLLLNTAPEKVLNTNQILSWEHCVKIDLASAKGLDWEDAVWARGLPGIHAPESSGQLIADTVSRLIKEARP